MIVKVFAMSALIMESTAGTRMNSRRRPLHTCGVSALAIAHKSYIKAQDLNEALGTKAKKIATLTSLVSSLVYALQHLWLAILSYFDDCILALEDAVESVFPPSKHVFNKADELVQIIEKLPGKFDNVLDKFPVIIEQVPLLDWALGQAISWLSILTSLLTQWGLGNAKEKEIVVDTGYNESNRVSAAPIDEAKRPAESPYHVGINNEETFPPVSEKPKTESEKVSLQAKPSAAKGTYREVLERRKPETTEKNETKIDSKKDENPSGTDVVKVEEAKEEASKRDGIVLKNDSILELFDSGWLMNNPVRNAIGSSVPRSVSYTGLSEMEGTIKNPSLLSF
ncbi:uncharacterized protein LOC110423634 [Herrania umbratica]|uniref:Uncharacterized protein LOC110423634 n=1 Tax=Herrania umbratica TaxID=108875 RepID=A0A6J1B353_9ROSI|nr:uncharacterized protein LOC110423634 [Herrania umbratica]